MARATNGQLAPCTKNEMPCLPQPLTRSTLSIHSAASFYSCRLLCSTPNRQSDGAHATSRCPHFRKVRDAHKDAWDGYSGEAEDGGGSGGNVRKAKAKKQDPPPLPRGTRVVPQPGDGSCLFHSLAFGMRALGRNGEKGVDADGLREAIASFIETNPEAELGGTPLSDWISWDSQMTVPAYCNRMRRGGEWGGAIELSTFSRLYDVGVHVYEKKGAGEFRLISCFEACASEGDDAVVRVLYSGRVHYDALVVDT